MVGADGREFDWEGMIGRATGPVDVCKTNHHAGISGMHPEFVKEVRAQVYLSSVWQAGMVDHKSLSAMCSRELYPGDRVVCFGAIADARRDTAAAYGNPPGAPGETRRHIRRAERSQAWRRIHRAGCTRRRCRRPTAGRRPDA